MKFVFPGVPQSTNDLYKFTCRLGYPKVYMVKAGKDLKEVYRWIARTSWKGEPISGRKIALKVVLYFKDERRHDIDNYNKILFDSMNGIVWEDDSQIDELEIRKTVDKSNPRIEVQVF